MLAIWLLYSTCSTEHTESTSHWRFIIGHQCAVFILSLNRNHKMVSNHKNVKTNPHQATIDLILNDLESISSARLQWQVAYDRSNQSLYDLLAACLTIYHQIKGQPVEREAVKAIHRLLEARGQSIKSGTRILTLVVRYVFSTEHKRAFIYSRALGIADKLNVTPDNFAEWVASSGGIEEVASKGASPATLAKNAAIAAKKLEVYQYLDDIGNQNPLATVQADTFIKDASGFDYTLFIAKTDAMGTSKVLCSVPDVSQAVIDGCIQKVAIAMINKNMSVAIANPVTASADKGLGSTPVMPEFTAHPDGIEVATGNGLDALKARINADLAAGKKQQDL